MEEQNTFKPRPAVNRLINEIKLSDSKVRVIGKIVTMDKNFFIIDDGSSSIEVRFDECKFDTGDQVKVFANIIPEGEKFILNSEIIQDVNNLDVELYRKVI